MNQPFSDTDAVAPMSFAYEAQTTDGRAIEGTIQADDAQGAREKLLAMSLRVLEIEAIDKPKKARALRRDELIVFNQQLAQLTAAGLPVEHGLRLIAQDMRSGRLRSAVEQVAVDLESGRPLPEAFEKHRGRFPSLYGRLIDAGVRTNNLPGMLFNLGKHLELISRLRETFWRTAAYPLMLGVFTIAILYMLGVFILPEFVHIFDDFDVSLPAITQSLVYLTPHIPWMAAVMLAMVIAAPLLWTLMRLTGKEAMLVDAVGLPLPLVGRCLRFNLLARWCDALHLAVEAGLGLPEAIDLAGQAVGSPTLRREGRLLTQALHQGESLGRRNDYRLITPIIGASIDLGSRQSDLPSTLAGLAVMYEKQAEIRLSVLRIILGPMLMMMLTGVIAYIVTALFLPLIAVVSALA